MSPRGTRLLIVAASAVGIPLVAGLGYFFSAYKAYSVPAESMTPTLQEGDSFFATRRPPADIKRGDIVLFGLPQGTYVHRVAALPGDRIALEDGIVILNGAPVAQAPTGAGRLREQFPGEAYPHGIIDSGASAMDDMDEQVVRPNHLFVLGDNRDMAADSRVPRDQMGAEQVPLESVRGKAMFHGFGSSRPFRTRIGG